MFVQHIAHLRTACEALHTHPEAASPMGRLVCAGLQELTSRAADFDAVVSSELHFKKHFLRLVTSLHVPTRSMAGEINDNGLILEMFEDLALVARTRFLSLGAGAISEAEHSILSYFEACGQWLKTDDTLVSRSYWYDLPEKLQTT